MSYHRERRGKEEHESALKEYISNCPNKIIDLAGKSPDAIEAFIVDGEVVLRAVEVLPARWNARHNRWKKTYSHKQKIDIYRMFDEVKIVPYRLEYSKE